MYLKNSPYQDTLALGNMKRLGKEPCEDLGVDERLIDCTLKIAVKIWDVKLWIGFSWRRMW